MHLSEEERLLAASLIERGLEDISEFMGSRDFDNYDEEDRASLQKEMEDGYALLSLMQADSCPDETSSDTT